MAAGSRMSSRTSTPLKLVHDAENGRSDAILPFAGTDLHTVGGDEADAAGFRDSSFCAFCAAPVSDSGEPCCADYAATVVPSAESSTNNGLAPKRLISR